ncbi:MAG: hypothetical protein ACREV1_00300 [Gammaproteobacteria bacterium]
MLNLDTSLELHGVTLFREYDPASKRYFFLPGSPHLSREGGEPLFQLLIYREDIAERPEFKTGDRDGGGFLTMTVDLKISQATRDAIVDELEKRVGGEVELVPVPFEKGSVRVTALGEAAGAAPALEGSAEDAAAQRPRSGFVEQILGSAQSNLYSGNHAVFSIELSRRGALLMKASIEEGGASQIAVVYDLEFRGLMPARECSITIDFKQTYQYLRTRATVNTLWFKSDIDSEFEKLQKEGHIKIEDVDYLGGDPAKTAERAEKLQSLAKELATWSFFKPGLQPGKVLAEDRGTLQVYDPTTAATADTQGFTTAREVAATGRGDTGDTAGPRQTGRSAVEAPARVSGERPPARGTGTPAAEDAAAPSAVERWNRAGRPQAGFLMRSLSQEEQQTITFNLRQVSAMMRSAAPQSSIRFAAGDVSLKGRVKMVDLNDPFFDVVAGTVTSTADFAAQGVRAMLVKLRYGVRPDGTGPKDTKEFPLTKTGDGGSYAFHLDHTFSMEIEYQVLVHYQEGFALGDAAAEAASPWIRTSTRNLDIDPRLLGTAFSVTLASGQVDWNVVKSIQSTVEYVDVAAAIQTSATRVLTIGNQTSVVNIRPKANGSRLFKVMSTFFYESTRDGPIVQEGRDTSLVVLNQPPSKAVPVNVTMVDPLGRIRKAVVELAYQGPSGPPQESLIELVGEGAAASWSFFRASLDETAKYRYRVTLFGKEGTTQQGQFAEVAERQLIVGDRIEGMLQVEVRILAENLKNAGFLLAKLRMEYPDAPEWADRDVEKTFEGAPQPFTWRVPKRLGGGNAYTYTVQWFRTDGSRVTSGPETVPDEVLIIIPPV